MTTDLDQANKKPGEEPENKELVSEIPFNKQLRKVTREIHAISDALVNAKLAFAISDNGVWAEGLLVFYEIFRFLEEAMVRLKGTPINEMLIDGMLRTEAFETDLEFYLGKNWKQNYTPRESVAKYLLHLQTLEKEEPIRLIAYVYHLYMGLFSGGQILRKKRELDSKINKFRKLFNMKVPTVSDAVTDFGEKKIGELKKELVNAVNGIAMTLDEGTKNAILEESKTVFELNNSIIKTVNKNEVILRRLLVWSMAFVSFMIMYFLVF